jgi:hypothetical protein
MRAVSVLTMKRMVVGCLLSAAAVGAACGRGTPTSPTASVAAANGLAAPATAVTGGEATQKANGQLPFHGSLEAIDTDTLVLPFLSVHLTGWGTATHLGDYTATIDFRVDLRTPTVPAVGSFTLTAANGDGISGDLLGRASIANGIANVVETATITGGTGRFADASGSFIVTRTVVQATGISSGSFEGSIDLHD